MFIWFGENKAHYEKGQIFPFAIAMLAMLLIMAMITANLGKLAIFKTDVSNAADAGALGGASILSGWLLGAGLTSDTWCGTAVVTTARMMEIAVLGRDDIHIPEFTAEDQQEDDSQDREDNDYQQFADTLVGMIMLFIQHLVKFYLAYPRILLDSMMTWSNAKQTALRSAFQNSGVDEQPSKKWKNYSREGGTYDEYINTYMSEDANQSGFSQFMSHTLSGYGKPLGKIGPGTLSDTIVTSGYGWRQEADETFKGSYEKAGNYGGGTYNDGTYDNWVQVQVQGSVMYPVEALSFADYFGDGVVTTLTAIVGVGSYLKYIGSTGGSGDDTVNELKEVYGLGYLLAAIFAIVTGVVFLGMIKYLPSGLTFKDRNDTLYTTENPIVVQVTRHKKNTDMGMWKFKYGDVTAVSGAHAFRENDEVTIEPVFAQSITDLGSSSGNISEPNWQSPEMIITVVQGAFCMGLTYSVAGSILTTCDMAGQECAEDYINMAIVAQLGGAVPVALEFIAFEYLCGDNTDSIFPQDGSATMNSGGFLGIDTGEWFKTDLHLFETELYTGYVG